MRDVKVKVGYRSSTGDWNRESVEVSPEDVGATVNRAETIRPTNHAVLSAGESSLSTKIDIRLVVVVVYVSATSKEMRQEINRERDTKKTKRARKKIEENL